MRCVYYQDIILRHTLCDTLFRLKNHQRPHPGKETDMKRIICIFLFVVLALPTWSLAATIGPARVSYMDGDILFRTPDADEWLPAAVNTPLDEGDAVWCPDGGRVEIQLPDGTIVRLNGGSQLDLLANEDSFMHLHLASGHLYLRTAQTTNENSLQIDADDTTVLPSARTRLRIDMLPNSEEDVAITKGSAYVEGNGSRTRVRAGEQILLEEGHSEILPLSPADSWEIWNVDRDRAQARSAKADTYLPDELRGYSSELDANGTWVNVPEYGMIWRPTVIVSNDWAPYRSGRWIWRGDDYVWLSFESWGWAPYHFGRWAVVNGFGWCWVPPVRGDVYWGPGYVGWYRTGSQVGWTPLAPGEKFYGHGNYGRNSVNITNININSSTVVYRNRTKPGGLTVLPQNDFLRGKSAIQQPSRNSSASVSVSVGSPRIKPLRETRMPIVKQTLPRVAPPQIEHRDSRDLRERFPRVAPAPAAERRRQQPAPAVSLPTTPTNRTPQIREKQTTNPVVAPAVRPPTPERQQPQTTPPQRDERRQQPTPPPTVSQPSQLTPPVSQPQQPTSQQREERRQGERPLQAPSQPTPTVTQSPPPVSGSAPQRSEQPRRVTTPADSQNRPTVIPSRTENRPTAAPAPVVVPPKTATPSPIVQPQKESVPKQMQPKKVWKVTTPENTTEKDPREKENRGKERREK
jgi:hypothetical protein